MRGLIKRKLGSLFSLLTVLTMAWTIYPIHVNALTTKQGVVDNDTSNPSYSNDSLMYTHYSGTWGTYLNSGYNGDARIRYSTSTGAYEWVWYGGIYSQTSVAWSVDVYLTNYSFTDPGAQYEIMCDSNEFIPFCVFYINQNIAPWGTTTFSGTETPSVYNGILHPWYAFVKNSGVSNVGTGADAFFFSFTY